MKLFYSLLLASAALTAQAAVPVAAEMPFGKPEKSILSDATSFSARKAPVRKTMQREAGEEPAPAPATLAGKTYVTMFEDSYLDYNGYFECVPQSDGSYVLAGLVEGLDAEATYDAATGTITIPTNVKIGTHQTYGDITLYYIYEGADGELNVGTDGKPITAVWNGKGFVFQQGLVGQVNAGYLVLMFFPVAIESNATMSVKLNSNPYQAALYIERTDETEIVVVGISNILYGGYCEVPFAINEETATAFMEFGTPVDVQQKSETSFVTWYLGGLVNGYIDNLETAIETTPVTSTLTNPAVFYGYQTDDGRFSGYQFTDFCIDTDFNVYTGRSASEEPLDYIPAKVDGLSYKLYPEALSAVVTGCESDITNLNIPATVVYEDAAYTVITIAEGAFANNAKITQLTIPATITSIGKDAFAGLSKIKKVYIADAAAWAMTELANAGSSPIPSVYAATSALKWGTVYFNGVQLKKRLEIPEGVGFINPYAFASLKEVQTIVLPSTLETIGKEAFNGNIAVKAIESYAVDAPAVGENAFGGIASTITVYAPEASIDIYKNAETWKDFTVYSPVETAGIEAVDASAANGIEYFNLQGVRIDKPAAGSVVIRREGSKTTKVVF